MCQRLILLTPTWASAHVSVNVWLSCLGPLLCQPLALLVSSGPLLASGWWVWRHFVAMWHRKVELGRLKSQQKLFHVPAFGIHAIMHGHIPNTDDSLDARYKLDLAAVATPAWPPTTVGILHLPRPSCYGCAGRSLCRGTRKICAGTCAKFSPCAIVLSHPSRRLDRRTDAVVSELRGLEFKPALPRGRRKYLSIIPPPIRCQSTVAKSDLSNN